MNDENGFQINLAANGAQRVGVFIDTQNLYHSAKANFRANVNYEELIYSAVAGRNLVRAFAYVIKSEDNTEEKFFDALEEIGIEIRVKDLQIFHTGQKKADWDVGIAVDMIRMTEKLDTVILASGDGDFLEVIRYCQSRGVRVEIMAFEKTCNAKIKDECDYFVDLAGDDRRYLIGSRNFRSYAKNGGNKATFNGKKNNFRATKTTKSEAASAENYNMPAIFKHQAQTSAASAAKNVANDVYKPKTTTSTRQIKPVVGRPIKANYEHLKRKNDGQTGSIFNAFGNKPN